MYVEKDLQQLLEKYARNECSDEEIRRLETWFIETGQGTTGKIPDDEAIIRMMEHIRNAPGYKEKESVRTIRMRFFAAAAAAAVLLVCGLLLKDRGRPAQQIQMADLPAGSNKALLTLADGSRIALTDAENGTLAQQEGINIIKNADGVVSYMGGNTKAHAATYNTIETPRGGQYQVTLPDGSKAWLNASSSLTFPVHFGTKERRVKMTGEVYFEITGMYSAADKERRLPFIVETGKQRIEVLGTRFNVHAYPDEPAQRTSLLEGSVRVVHPASNTQAMLKPGQQATTTDRIRVMNADIDGDMAWKNGDFIFRDEQLESILRKVARWYDVGIECPPELGHIRFNGMVSRQQPLSAIIEMIASTGKVKLTFKERRIVVNQ